MSTTLDTSGLQCPLPVLKAKKALKAMAPGDRITVISTDPGSVKDFEAFCEATGDTRLESTEQEGAYNFLIEKGG